MIMIGITITQLPVLTKHYPYNNDARKHFFLIDGISKEELNNMHEKVKDFLYIFIEQKKKFMPL